MRGPLLIYMTAFLQSEEDRKIPEPSRTPLWFSVMVRAYVLTILGMTSFKGQG